MTIIPVVQATPAVKAYLAGIILKSRREAPSKLQGVVGGGVGANPELNIAMDVGIDARAVGGDLTLSLSFNDDRPLGSFFHYICDNGTYKSF
jgi:hypothetical protein